MGTRALPGREAVLASGIQNVGDHMDTTATNLRFAWVCIGLAGLVAACGGGSEDVKRPLDPPGRDTQATYEVGVTEGGVVEAQVRFVGETTFNGQAWEKYEFAYPKPEGTKMSHVYGVASEGRRIVLAGGDVVYPPGDIRHKDYVVTLDEPVAIDLDEVPVGAEQTTQVSGTIQITGQPAIHAGGTATWKKTAVDAVVETKMGTVAGVEVYEGEAVLTEGEGHWVLDAVKGLTVHGKAWVHPKMGLLKYETPEFPIGGGLVGSRSCGDPTAGDTNTIQAVGIVSPQQPVFELDTSDCSGEWDADKMRHAQMLLELRFADDDKARTSDAVPVSVTFGTAWGWFPFQLLPSPVSIFHPEENGQGYTFWYAYVNEGAKNEPGDNGILYRIEVRSTDYQTSPVRAAARIHYGIYRP